MFFVLCVLNIQTTSTPPQKQSCCNWVYMYMEQLINVGSVGCMYSSVFCAWVGAM